LLDRVFRHIGKFAYYRLAKMLGGIAGRAPRLALRGGVLLGRVAHAVNGPSSERVKRVFPQLSAKAARRVAIRISCGEACNIVVRHGLHRSGLRPFRASLAGLEPFEALRPPMVLATFHVAALDVAIGLRDALQGPVFLVSRPSSEVPDECVRASLFMKAVRHLRQGGFVVTAADALPSATIAVPFFGGTILMSRGLFVMARRTGVPFVPMIAAWRNGRAKIVVGDPIQALSDECTAAAAAQWLEKQLMDFPSDIGAWRLDECLR
jgi:lauroyl/myristoyl acyltransferase